jgi:hypothetical protein
MNRGELESKLIEFEQVLRSAGMRDSAVLSYLDYSHRFVRWLVGDYRPRNAAAGSAGPPFATNWSVEDLKDRLGLYATDLRAAHLRPNAVNTYVHSSKTFVRWLAGEYRPRNSQPTAELGVRPNDLAAELGVPGIAVRNYLRGRYPRDDKQKHAAWYLSAEQADEVRGAFNGRPTAANPLQAAVVRPVGPRPTDWFWEGNVQDAFVRYLAGDGWHVESTAETVSRGRGHDVVARKGSHRLTAEVKGYPSIAYRDPRRAAEVKRTQPTTQAKHWYADALLKAIRLRTTTPKILVGLVFPHFPRYLRLLDETDASLRTLGIGVYLVEETGRVAIHLEPAASLT